MSQAGDHDPQWEATARKVREELARRRMSRQALADLARISISTLEKALSGQRPFTMATLIRLEEALGAPLRQTSGAGAAGTAPAPEDMGSYSRGAVRWLEGRYVTLRPSFSGGGDAVYAYCTSIDWDGERSCLCFSESERCDTGFTQHGSVSMPHLSGHIYLVTNEGGQYRLAILARPTAAGSLFGILATLLSGQGSQLIPAACPIALLRMDRMETPAFGRIEAGHDRYAEYRAQLDSVTARDFARFPILV